MSCDLDDWLAYTTEKQVRIRHRWIGIIYYLTILLIVGYVLAYEIIYQRGYAKFQSLSGTVRATVLPPSRLRPANEQPYCASPQQHPAAHPLPCVAWDPTLTTRFSSGGGLLVGTRISRKVQRRNTSCPDMGYPCRPWYNDEANTTYVGDIERWTILVQHSVSATSILSRFSGSLDSFGKRPAAILTGANTSAHIETIPCGEPAHIDLCGRARGDLFSVAELLRAANIALDKKSHSIAKDSGYETLRYAGIALVLTIEYFAGLDGNKYSYTVNVSKLEASETFFGAFSSSLQTGPDAIRELFDVHGIQILFVQSGGLNTFDIRTLLLTFVSGIALVSMAKTVANVFLLYLSPHRADYSLFVMTQSPDFSPDNETERHILQETLGKKRNKNARLSGKHANALVSHILDPLSATPIQVDTASGSLQPRNDPHMPLVQ
eukprot:CAMPEP_0119303528 /NCGR_PEP_ID=MMETSP1333-20130426/4948_1 /TAXON_ID=418940 /ORGANISM="Scyphosphaera apsteinii, Strain RCC1455" /LENGTH=434 /DNA_ID=CAMNT_0007306233 /DNA_START=169 /DNA_END=1473 /DNA_ORIENTATION=-